MHTALLMGPVQLAENFVQVWQREKMNFFGETFLKRNRLLDFRLPQQRGSVEWNRCIPVWVFSLSLNGDIHLNYKRMIYVILYRLIFSIVIAKPNINELEA